MDHCRAVVLRMKGLVIRLALGVRGRQRSMLEVCSDVLESASRWISEQTVLLGVSLHHARPSTQLLTL